MKERRPPRPWVDPIAQAAYDARRARLAAMIAYRATSSGVGARKPPATAPRPQPQHDHAAHLAARLTESFQRNQLAKTSEGTPSMSSQLTPENQRRAWAKGFGNKRVQATIPAPMTEHDAGRTAWAKALKRSVPDAPAASAAHGSASKPIDRKAAWAKALKQAPVASRLVKD